MSTSKDEPRYHHGDLRRALVAGGLVLLEEKGASALGLREIARLVGVSAAAPYRHFADRKALLDQAGLAAREAREVSQGMLGSLQIGFAGTVLYRGLPQILQGFAVDHPKLRLVLRELSSSDQLIDLMHERLDIGFVHTTRVPAGFSQILVSSQPFVACLPVDHALARRKRLSLARLQGEPFAVVSRAVSPDYHERILGLCADAGFSPEIRFELRHWLSVVSIVAQGLGCALVPAALQQAGLPGAAFVPLDVDTPPYETPCLWKTDRDQAALGAFLGAVRGFAQPLQ